jgi:septum formation protein
VILLDTEIVLASASPRRATILRALGVRFRVQPADVDETLAPGEDAAGAAERLARAKASAIADSAVPVLAADTLVVCDDEILGKPRDPADAARMLRRLRGRSHQVVTGVCVRRGADLWSEVDSTRVTFAPMTEAEIAWYVGTGEPLDKAGAYHVDGRGSLFLESVEGSPSNVAGLPVRLLRNLLREAGLGLGGNA